MSEKTKSVEKKQKKSLNSIALLFFIIIAMVIFTWIIPAGSYIRVELNGRNVVDPSSFTFIESNPATLFDIFVAVPSGMTNAVSLIVGAMLIGGGMEVLQLSGAINIGISRSIRRIGIARGNIILVFLFYIFALMGGFLGFIEGSIPFIPIAISIAVALGYDTVVGVAIAVVGAIAGFTCGPTNPYTVGVSQTVAGIPMYSGIGLRVVLFVVVPAVCLLYILRYARMVQKSPEKSLMAGIDVSDISFDVSQYDQLAFTAKHALVLMSLLCGLICYVYGAINWGFGFNQLGAIFVIIAVFTGIVFGFGVNRTAETFVKGAQGMVGAAFIMGVAYGISWVLTKANVLDTLVYYLSKPLTGLSPAISIIGILVVIMLINLLIPSGSGKALIVMPIVLPIADIVGITPQIAILAYQFGDGLTNLCTPLLGVLLLALGFGKVPFSKWEKFILPLVGLLTLIACVTLVLAMMLGYQ